MALEDSASVHSVLTQPVDGLVRDGGAESVSAALKDLGTEADPRVRHGSLRTVLLEQPGESDNRRSCGTTRPSHTSAPASEISR
jgi:hypothetical protein